MKCPGCGGGLAAFRAHGIDLDRCPQCAGVWFDAGELAAYREARPHLVGGGDDAFTADPAGAPLRCPRCEDDRLAPGRAGTLCFYRCGSCRGAFVPKPEAGSGWARRISWTWNRGCGWGKRSSTWCRGSLGASTCCSASEQRRRRDSVAGVSLHITRQILAATLVSAVLVVGCDWGRGDLPKDPGSEAPRAAARAFAEAFLAAADAGEVADTWPLVAETLRQRSGREVWEATLRSTRAALGSLRSRELSRHGFSETLAEAPPGDYFVFDFNSEFERAMVVERVVCVLQGSEGWRVAGYFVTTVAATE